MNNFGTRLKLLADKLGKEDQDVARDLGLSKAQMSHYTTGKRKVPSELLQKIVDIYNINPQFLFREDTPLYLEPHNEKDTSILISENEPKNGYKINFNNESTYPYIPVSISAGIPSNIDCVSNQEVTEISLPDIIMGKWAKSRDIKILRVNGESMNKIIPHNSLIAIKTVELSELNDNDIVVFSNGYEYSVKKFFNDNDNKKVIFRPESTDKSFIDYSVPYDNAKDLRIHGKVVVYMAALD